MIGEVDAEGIAAVGQSTPKGGVPRPDVQKAFKNEMTRLVVEEQPGFRYSGSRGKGGTRWGRATGTNPSL